MIRFTQFCLPRLLLAASITFQPFAAFGQAPKPGDKTSVEGSTKDAKTKVSQQESVYRALQKPIDVNWDAKPLIEALIEVAHKASVEFRPDEQAMDDLGLDFDSIIEQEVSLKLARVPAHWVLDVLLRPHELTWTLGGAVVWITTVDACDNSLMTRVYDVADLTVWRKDGKPIKVDFDSLIQAVTATVQVESWDESGGPGSIVGYQSNGVFTLIVSQTPRVHLQIDRLLADLRKIPRETGLSGPLSTIPGQSGIGELAGQLSHSKPSEPPVDVPVEIVGAGNLFTCDLFRQLARQEPNGNLIASPYSVYECLGMTFAGARGKTMDELSAVTHFPSHDESLHAAMASIRRRWKQVERTEGITLHIANRLWADFDAAVTGEYVRSIANHYDGEFARLDLTNSAEAARRVNEWVADETAGHIQTLVAPESFPNELVPTIALTNAVCFDGKWSMPFQPSSTYDATFRAFGVNKPIRMMTHEKTYRFAMHEGAMVLEKPYTGESTAGAEDGMAMWFLLPPEGRDVFDQFQQSLTPAEIDAWSGRLAWTPAEVHIPRFKFESRPAMKNALQNLGLKSLFIRGKANLTGIIDDTRLFVYAVEQVAKIEVGEAGTRASAATFGGGGYFGGPPPGRLVFRADRPFVFLIRDGATGAILFIGRFMGPDDLD